MKFNCIKNIPIQLMAACLLLVFLCAGQLPYAGAAPVKIMPLGDSITGTPGCWRALLWNRLQNAGYTNIDFVGTQSGQTCSLPFDADCEGHGGIRATDIASQNQLTPWLASAAPDIVLMHLGTNDIMTDTITTDQLIAAYGKMVDQMRASNPNMKILVAQIIPAYTATAQCTACYQRVVSLNAAIPAWAAGKTTAQSPIVVVDQWTGFDTTTDTGDGIHPNDKGNQKMSDKWYPALVNFLTSGPTATPTRTPTLVPTPTPAGLKGDANGSGKVDIVDAMMIAQYASGMNPAGFKSANADVNCDGTININDALLVARYAAGLITSLGC